MSGDVQPRKRKDKKRKKEDGGPEEPRGTAAALGEGDVFMHSQHEHGTGGHWCAKIVFFSLLAVLLGLIALIILENRGLSDLEASTVESRYSGVLEGWLEDAPDDDHHDEHTLELNHPNIEDESAEGDLDLENGDHEDDEQKSEEFDDTDDDHSLDEDHDEDEDVDEDQDHEDNESVENFEEQYGYFGDGSDQVDPDEDDKDDDNNDEYEPDNTYDKTNNENDNDNIAYSNNAENLNNDINDHEYDENDDDNENENSVEYNSDEDDEVDHDDEQHDDSDIEVEHIEHEVDEDPISNELPALPEEDDNDKKSGEQDDKGSFERDIDDYLEHEEVDDDDDDDIESEIVEHISVPSGKPLKEVEYSNEDIPADTLKDEEEYEQRQEELRRQTAESSHVWLKLGVGAALLLATHAVVRRASRHDNTDVNTEDTALEELATIDRRMTLIPEEEMPVTAQKTMASEPSPKEVFKKPPILIKTSPTIDDNEEDEVEEDIVEQPTNIKNIQTKRIASRQETPDKEMYSDEDEKEELEQFNKKQVTSSTPVVTQDNDDEESEDVADDVEIIDEDQIEEELEEEDDEEEISDVDDAELLNRLEAKYGRLPEPERPGQKYKDGGNNIDEWPGEPSDSFWNSLLDQAEEHHNLGEWEKAAQLANAPQIDSSGRALWITASAMDKLAEARRDNKMLSRAIDKYLQLLKMNNTLTDKQLLMVTNRTIDRMNFRGAYLATESVYRLLIRRFPNEPGYYNNLTISFLMANRPELASEIAQITIRKWPQDRLALAHFAFVLKTHYKQLPEAVSMFKRALDGDRGAAVEPRFYYHLGDALLLLGMFEDAHLVHQRAAALGLFLSASQRSLYNVNRLKSKPWWKINETPYGKLAEALENSWKDILVEAEAAAALYVEEKEGLRERGEWSQLDLFVRGQEVPGRCKRAPVTCAIVRMEPAAVGCRRGQIKFSAIEPGTHIRPHVGPTNCRLRMHLGLKNTENSFIRVDQETRQWKKGKVLLFDDSFEHEVWHRGNKTRLVLIVDVWHPDLTPAERRTLPSI